MNIAVVVLDTLRKDAFDTHFDWLPGKRFEWAWSPARWTVPAHTSLFGGYYPSELGGHDEKTLSCTEPVLAELLSEAGYTTHAFSSNPNISWAFDFDRGFDEFEGSWRLDPFRPDTDVFDWNEFIRRHGGAGAGRYLKAVRECVTSEYDTFESLKEGVKIKLRDMGYNLDHEDDGANATLKYLKQTHFAENEFVFINLMEAHEPYTPPKEFRTVDRYQSGDFFRATVDEPDFQREPVKQAYDDSVRYLSHIYERIYHTLREDFEVVITVSDHGELFGEHGAWGHCHGVYPELARVPVVVSGESISTETSDETVSLLDVHRTVLELADVDGDSRGQHLLGELDGREYLVEDAGVSDERILNLRSSGFDDEALEPYLGSFHGIAMDGFLGYEAPTGFITAGDGSQSDAKQQLAALMDGLKESSGGTTDEALSTEAEAQLRDLGYM